MRCKLDLVENNKGIGFTKTFYIVVLFGAKDLYSQQETEEKLRPVQIINTALTTNFTANIK